MIDIGALFSSSWTKFSKNIGMGIVIFVVGGIVGSFLACATLGIAAIPVYAGLYKSFRKMQRGAAPDFNDLFSEFSNFGQWFQLWLAAIVIYIGCFIVSGILLLLAKIPIIGILFMLVAWLVMLVLGLAVGLSFFFVIPLMLERRMSAFDALKASFEKVKSNVGALVLPMVLVMIVYGVFAILTAPWMMIAMWDLYDATFTPGSQV